ncbi:MAG: phosphate butyryltransferase [Candidatus Marinimicrobia bacterium]|nr:phosphate butyryltransferase [Candidatus Neomarinimicrobiota bacterium]MCF7829964.1 phosphate butyryltransferase [Candidatus Neomarinimicrobiota bacterium]MCF7881882.1 phosphate butyryltransferase [Candidatus Neomarinimicrobiota bacterium]
MIRSFAELVSVARSGEAKRVVIAGCGNKAVVEAVRHAAEEEFSVPILIGNEKDVEQALPHFPAEAFVLTFTEEDDRSIADTAVSLIMNGEGDILLKGSVSTELLMKAVLNKKAGIRDFDLLSDCFLFETDDRIVTITDGGVVLYPDVDQKQRLIENAVRLYHSLGYEEPKVAVCAAIENVNEKMQATVDAAELTRRNREGELTGCIVDGPLALDLALSQEALAIKGVESPLNGSADILVMPNIEVANMVAKSTQYIAGKEAAHIIMGASNPVLIPSRSDTARGKYLSIALAVAVS